MPAASRMYSHDATCLSPRLGESLGFASEGSQRKWHRPPRLRRTALNWQTACFRPGALVRPFPRAKTLTRESDKINTRTPISQAGRKWCRATHTKVLHSSAVVCSGRLHFCECKAFHCPPSTDDAPVVAPQKKGTSGTLKDSSGLSISSSWFSCDSHLGIMTCSNAFVLRSLSADTPFLNRQRSRNRVCAAMISGATVACAALLPHSEASQT